MDSLSRFQQLPLPLLAIRPRTCYERTIAFQSDKYAADLYRLYVVEQRSSVEIGKVLNLHYLTVLSCLRHIGIAIRDNSAAQRKRMGFLSLTPELAAILDGELLGDGCLMQPRDRDAYLVWCTTRRGYIEWLHTRLNGLGLHGSASLDRPNPGKVFSAKLRSSLETRRYPELTALRARWYPGGKKAVPRGLMLTPLACLHWYLGDGCLNHPLPTPYITLSTHCFSENDVAFLVSLLHGVGCMAKKGHHPNGPVITMSKDACLAFFRYMGPCPEGLEAIYGYKWRARGGE